MRKRKKRKRFLYIPFIILILVLGYLAYSQFLKEDESEEKVKERVEQTQPPVEKIEEEEIVPQGPAYEELFPVIDGQQAYVVVPTNINQKNPPTLILYSHGSNTTVTTNMEDQFMKDLQQYGIFFTSHNYIFSASNQHGVNWGNTASVQDTLNLKNWVAQNYNIQPKVYLIGFSMGGLPTMNFASSYPDTVERIALLAPTTKSSAWNQGRADLLKSMTIKLWHGNKDVNVPYSYSVSFVKKLEGYGIYIDFVTLEGKGHFDIDTEYMEDILEFFSS